MTIDARVYPSSRRKPSAHPRARYGQEGFGGLKKILRKIAPVAVGAAAVASGNPQLAIPAATATSSVTKKKAKVAPPAPPVSDPGFLANLGPADRNALLIGGGLVGALVLMKMIGGRR